MRRGRAKSLLLDSKRTGLDHRGYRQLERSRMYVQCMCGSGEAECCGGGETMVDVEAAAEQDEGGTVGQANGCLVSPAARGRRYLRLLNART